MSEQRAVLDAFEGAGVLAGVRWAYRSATERALGRYCEADGLDPAWLGITRFTLFRDRLDRVFGCERYALRSGDARADLDVLYAELSQLDVDTMPHPTGAVRRSDLSGSPGWAFGDWRFLLASCDFGKIDLLPWPQKSVTKQRVARQHNPDPAQPSLFEEFAPAEVGGLAALAGEDLNTFVLAHSLDSHTRRGELVFGRPRLNVGGGSAWHWRRDILEAAGLDGARPGVGFGPFAGPEAVPDAPVRLRPAEERRRAGGEW